jgi:hypothetical protein
MMDGERKMSKFIPCILADISIDDNGKMDCVWLTPYIGDLTSEEYEARGTALTVKRGCEYCYKYLEWKTKVKEERWELIFFANGVHPDWPGEWCCVHQVKDKDLTVGYEVQFKLYQSLHDIVSAGWEFRWDYYQLCNKKIFEEEILNSKGYSVMKQLKFTFDGGI